MFENKTFTSYTVDTSIWSDLKNYLESLSCKSILIVGGKNGYEMVKGNLISTLEELNIKYEYTYYGGECSWSNIDKVKKKQVKGSYDIILGVGGGKALDTAKAASDMLAIDIITIPTIPATCAATTSLSVIYDDSGEFSQLFYLKNPPGKTFVDLETLSKAPEIYLKAGMGDTLAKYYEVKILTEGLTLNYSSTLGVNLSLLCKESILKFGATAYEDNCNNKISQPLKEVITTNIITTGLVSCSVDEEFNSAIAHSIAMGFSIIDGFDEEILHGETVAYGILIQTLLEGDIVEYNKLKEFYTELELPISLNELPLDDKIKLYKDDVLSKIMVGSNVGGFSFLTKEKLINTMGL